MVMWMGMGMGMGKPPVSRVSGRKGGGYGTFCEMRGPGPGEHKRGETSWAGVVRVRAKVDDAGALPWSYVFESWSRVEVVVASTLRTANCPAQIWSAVGDLRSACHAGAGMRAREGGVADSYSA